MNKLAMSGLIIILLFIVLAVGTHINSLNMRTKFRFDQSNPDSIHWFGTDELGIYLPVSGMEQGIPYL